MKNYLKTLFLEKKDIFYIFKSRFLMNHKSLYFYFLQNFIDFQRNIP